MKKSEDYKIEMDTKYWTMLKKLTNKGHCKCYKDPSMIFQLGLETACKAHNVS